MSEINTLKQPKSPLQYSAGASLFTTFPAKIEPGFLNTGENSSYKDHLCTPSPVSTHRTLLVHGQARFKHIVQDFMRIITLISVTSTKIPFKVVTEHQVFIILIHVVT